MRHNAFTLLEVMMVVIIIGILATVTVPAFTRSFEIAKGRESETSLRIIFQAERAYYFDQTPNSYGTLANLVPTYLPSANSLDSADWLYAAVPDNAATPPTFVATATRTGGPNNNQTRTIDQTGTIAPATWPP